MDVQKILSQSGKNPQSILKIVLGISLALLVMWLFLVSKMDTGTIAQTENPEVQERTVGLQQSLLLNNTDGGEGQSAKKAEEPAMFQNAFITFLFMVSVLAGVWYWSRKKGGRTVKEKKNRDIDVHILSEKSQLKFVEVNEEVWVLGLGEHGVNLLHRYSKDEWKEGKDELSTDPLTAHKESTKETTKGDFRSLLKLAAN
ncbi:MAG: flagellar biosynthetic protein FliO [Gracilimonas sp.]